MQDLNIDPWEFALRLTHLVDLGVDESDLQWLFMHGYVAFRDRVRRCQPNTAVAAGGDRRFMITAAGVLASGLGREQVGSPPRGSSYSAESVGSRSCLPCWDRKLRQLFFDGCLVKRFRLPASNQEVVLSAFEEEGWPPSIDDPLPVVPNQRPKQRLHVTIRHLNANHHNRVIRFCGNGTGEAVLWEPVAVSAVEQPIVSLGFRRPA